MTKEKLLELFEKHHGEYLEFSPGDLKHHRRPDLNAFLLLDKLVPGSSDMVDAAEHDEIFLQPSLADLATTAGEEDIIELIRCGVRLSEFGCLAMFV
jgi:hypothetical protein